MSVPLAYLGIIVIWSTTPLAIKWSGEEVGFLMGVGARMMIAAVVCIAIFALFRWPIPRHKKALHVYLAVGLPLYLAMICVYWGAQYISSGLISVVFGLTPIFTGLFAALWLKESFFSPSRLAGVMLGLGGLALIFHHSLNLGQGAGFGLAMVLAATVTHSFGTVWTKYVVNHLTPFEANTGGVTVSAILFGVTFLLTGQVVPEHVPDYVGLSIVYLAVFGSVIGAVLFYYALRRVEATTMGMLTLITPVTALFLGRWFNSETIDGFTIAGTLLIMLGLLTYQWVPVYKKYLNRKLPDKKPLVG